MQLFLNKQEISFENLSTYARVELKEKELYLFYTSHHKKYPRDIFNFYLNFLPDNLKNEVTRYRRWEDQHNCLFGKLLIYVAYYLCYKKKISFNDIKKGKNGKPYLEKCDINFNISHSATTVMCLIGKHNVGVDVEEMRETDFAPFKNFFSPAEIQEIRENGIRSFYKYWTIKEAVLKAIGTGIDMELLSRMKIEKNYVICDNIKYFVSHHQMNNMMFAIASRVPETSIILSALKFEENR